MKESPLHHRRQLQVPRRSVRPALLNVLKYDIDSLPAALEMKLTSDLLANEVKGISLQGN